jgi:hypothetical protein
MIVVALGGCENQGRDDGQGGESPPPQRKARVLPKVLPIVSIKDFQKALRCPRAILFFDSGLSVRILLTKRDFLRFAELHHDAPNSPPVWFFMVDFTDPEGPLWDEVMSWMHAHCIPDGGLKSWGCTGKTVWIADGVPRAYLWSSEELTPEIFTESTRKIFPDAGKPSSKEPPSLLVMLPEHSSEPCTP